MPTYICFLIKSYIFPNFILNSMFTFIILCAANTPLISSVNPHPMECVKPFIGSNRGFLHESHNALLC